MTTATAPPPASGAPTPRRAGSRRRTLRDLTRGAHDTLTACREAARATATAFRTARGTTSVPSRPRYDTGYRPRSVAVRQHATAVAELVRAPAALTVPGDVLAGALSAGRPAGGRTLLLAASSVSLYWAGMALNDWADREEDARERPERPVPSGRISAGAALGIAGGLTAAGLGLGALAGGRRVLLRRTLPLAVTVWAYDLGLKHTPLGPVAMAAARALDVLHGTGPTPAGPALRAAATVGAHTWALTRLSRHEVNGTAGREPALSLATTAAVTLAATAGSVRASRRRRPNTTSAVPRQPNAPLDSASGVARQRSSGRLDSASGGARQRSSGRLDSASGGARQRSSGRLDSASGGARQPSSGPLNPASAVPRDLLGSAARSGPGIGTDAPPLPGRTIAVTVLTATVYAVTCARAQLAALRDPDAARTRAAVGAGIHALLPLQAALVSRTGSPKLAALLAAVLPQAARLARKVSPT
ncbi:SCO3242 family prenyltransferase [Streptomyces turgidiscabies]|uniref:SCO3242 family prenyltransferase n=2 Tax=Streptomyces TaxID=1883 RepID=UPI0029B27277|nr:UbiA family prenyltransferase [Streptomyces turgidiscabies]MDX3500026.1 UbiA family prenyltransferase [Streptomyces turgidiscabies]